MWTILQQTVHDIAQISDMIHKFNSVVADMKTNVIYFEQLLSSIKQDEIHLVAVQLEKVLSYPKVDFIDTLLNPSNAVTFSVWYTGLK